MIQLTGGRIRSDEMNTHRKSLMRFIGDEGPQSQAIQGAEDVHTGHRCYFSDLRCLACFRAWRLSSLLQAKTSIIAITVLLTFLGNSRRTLALATRISAIPGRRH